MGHRASHSARQGRDLRTDLAADRAPSHARGGRLGDSRSGRNGHSLAARRQQAWRDLDGQAASRAAARSARSRRRSLQSRRAHRSGAPRLAWTGVMKRPRTKLKNTLNAGRLLLVDCPAPTVRCSPAAARLLPSPDVVLGFACARHGEGPRAASRLVFSRRPGDALVREDPRSPTNVRKCHRVRLEHARRFTDVRPSSTGTAAGRAAAVCDGDPAFATRTPGERRANRGASGATRPGSASTAPNLPHAPARSSVGRPLPDTSGAEPSVVRAARDAITLQAASGRLQARRFLPSNRRWARVRGVHG